MTNSASSLLWLCCSAPCACMCVLLYFSFVFFLNVFSHRDFGTVQPREWERILVAHSHLLFHSCLSWCPTLRFGFASSTRLRRVCMGSSVCMHPYTYFSTLASLEIDMATECGDKNGSWRKTNDESTCRYDSFCEIDSAIRPKHTSTSIICFSLQLHMNGKKCIKCIWIESTPSHEKHTCMNVHTKPSTHSHTHARPSLFVVRSLCAVGTKWFRLMEMGRICCWSWYVSLSARCVQNKRRP